MEAIDGSNDILYDVANPFMESLNKFVIFIMTSLPFKYLANAEVRRLVAIYFSNGRNVEQTVTSPIS